jgi:hypothetical protein
MYRTSSIQSLSSPTVLFSFTFSNKSLVFGGSLTYHLERIIMDLVLMILFGISYPFCYLILLIDFTSRIYLVIQSVHLYIKLHQKNIGKNSELDKENCEYLENMILDAISSASYFIWPGLGAATVVFGLYIFDMAWDSEDNALGAPIAVLVVNTVSFVAIYALFLNEKLKTEADLATRVFDTTILRTNQVELQDSSTLNIVKNPVCL